MICMVAQDTFQLPDYWWQQHLFTQFTLTNNGDYVRRKDPSATEVYSFVSNTATMDQVKTIILQHINTQ